jgi:hypothetical protein
MSLKLAYTLIALAITTTSCSQSVAMLPTMGRVYRESGVNDELKLSPASGIELVAQRVNVCDKKSWLIGEASTTGIDSFIVTTDSDGYYHVPPRSFTGVCSRIVLRGTAISPYLHSTSALVARSPVVGNPKRYGWLGDSDVILNDAAIGIDRIQELSGDLNHATGSYAVSETIRKEVYFRLFQEICRLHKDFPKDSATLYDDAVSILEKQCD